MKPSKPSKWIAACAAVLLTATTLVARAEDPKPAIFARASISSLDDVKKFVTELGLPLPADPTQMLEGMFPFIGPGGMQTDKPVGALFVAGEKLAERQQVIITLPVVAGKATLADLTKTGGTAVADHPDMASVADTTFRRTANYLMFYTGTAGILASATDDAFAKDYTRPGRVALVSVDLTAAKAAAPSNFKAFLDHMHSPPTPGADPAAEKAGEDMVKNFISGLDRVSLALSRDDQYLHIETWMRPFDVQGSRKFPQPTFPADTIAQMNIAYPNAQMADWMAHAVDSIPVDKFTGPRAAATEAPKNKAVAIKFIHLLFNADAESFALTMKDGKPVLYAVNQYGTDVDVAKELQPIVTDMNAISKVMGDGEAVTISTYQSDAGKTVTRLAIMDKGQRKATVDFIQNGRVVTFAIAPDEGKYVDAVASLPTKGEMSNLCTGSIDLTAALKASQASGQAPPLPPSIIAACNGQSITWTVKTIEQSKYVYIDLGLPIAVLKEGGKIASGFMGAMGGGPGGPPPGRAPMQNR